MTPSPLELAVEALEKISGASFEGASKWAINGEWYLVTNAMLDIAASALAAIRQEGVSSYPVADGAARYVDGWTIVPTEPTREQLRALLVHRGYDPDAKEETLDTLGNLDVMTMGAFVSAYRAMIAAAPAPPTDRAGPSATDYDPIPSDRLAAPGWRPDREQIVAATMAAISSAFAAFAKADGRGKASNDRLIAAHIADAILALKPPPTDEMR